MMYFKKMTNHSNKHPITQAAISKYQNYHFPKLKDLEYLKGKKRPFQI